MTYSRGNRPHENKGWTVCTTKGRKGQTYNNVIILHRDGRREYVLQRPDWLDAVHCAITEAARRGALNWAATRAWGEKKGVVINYDAAMADTSYVGQNKRREKGWFVHQGSYSSKDGKKIFYSVSFGLRQRPDGKSLGKGRYQVSRPPMVSGIRYALSHKHENPDYNEENTINWLREKGHESLIPMATNQKKEGKAA